MLYLYFLTLNVNRDNADNERKYMYVVNVKRKCCALLIHTTNITFCNFVRVVRMFNHKFRPMDRDTFVHRRQLQAWALAR